MIDNIQHQQNNFNMQKWYCRTEWLQPFIYNHQLKLKQVKEAQNIEHMEHRRTLQRCLEQQPSFINNLTVKARAVQNMVQMCDGPFKYAYIGHCGDKYSWNTNAFPPF